MPKADGKFWLTFLFVYFVDLLVYNSIKINPDRSWIRNISMI